MLVTTNHPYPGGTIEMLAETYIRLTAALGAAGLEVEEPHEHEGSLFVIARGYAKDGRPVAATLQLAAAHDRFTLEAYDLDLEGEIATVETRHPTVGWFETNLPVLLIAADAADAVKAADAALAGIEG